MVLNTKYLAGYNGSPVLWTGPDEVAWTCGNAVVLHSLNSKTQRVLKGSGYGISCFAVDKKHHLLAIGEKGLNPHVAIYSTTSLQCLARFTPSDPPHSGEQQHAQQQQPQQQRSAADGVDGSAQGGGVIVMGVTALAFSGDGERLAVCGDEPDCSVIIYLWRKGEALVRSRAPAPVLQASFHPYDPAVLATTGGGSTAVWYIESLWDRPVFRHTLLGQGQGQGQGPAQGPEPGQQDTASEPGTAAADTAPVPAAGVEPWRLASGQRPTAHAWSPYGLYCGTNDGTLVLLDLASMQPVMLPGASAAGGANPPGGEDGGDGAAAGLDGGMRPAVVPNCVGPGGGVAAIALNRDHVAVTGTDGSVHVFDAVGAGAAGLGMGLGPSGPNVGLPGWGAGGHGPHHGGGGGGGGGGGMGRAHSLPPHATALEFSHEVWLTRGGAKGVAVSSADVGGGDHATLLLGCPDGTLYRAAVAPHKGAVPGTRAGYTLATPLMDCHVGRISGVVPHPGGGAFVSSGADGSLRVWGAADGSLLAKRSFGSVQCAIAAASPGAAMVAVGSETGVVRVVTLPPAPDPDAFHGSSPGAQGVSTSASALNAPLRVLFRRRLHAGPVDALIFSPDNELIASAGRDGTVWLLSLSARSGTVRPLGFVTLPAGERVLGATWPRVSDTEESVLLSLTSGGILCLAVAPELASGNWRNPNPDMALLRPVGLGGGRGMLGSDTGEGSTGPGGAGAPGDPVSIKLLRVEVPLLAVASTPGSMFGDVYALGADKQLHKVVLPTDVAAWAGLRARPHRSAARMHAHARAAGAVALAPGGQMLLSGGGDGAVALHSLNLTALASTAPEHHSDGAGCGGLHDVAAGGITGVAVEPYGRFLASTGADGLMCVLEIGVHAAPGLRMPDALASLAQLAPPPPAVVLPAAEDVDEQDDPAELTEVAALKRAAAGEGAGGGGETRRAAMSARVAQLRTRVEDLMATNNAAPELERLDRSELIVDVGLVDDLKREAEQRVAAVQAGVRQDHLRTELLAERVRRSVWDAMAVKGAVVSGLRSQAQVHNFPLPQPQQHERVLRQVSLLRRVEMAEHRTLGVMSYSAMFRGHTGDGSAEDVEGTDPGSEAGGPGRAGAAADTSVTAGSDVGPLLYSDFDLHCTTRKVLQVHLIKQKIRDLKASFNTDFQRLAAQKRSDCDRIADLNARLDDTLKDLRKLGAAPPAGLLEERFQLTSAQDTRDNLQVTVLTVRDEEVKVGKYVSPEEQARAEAARRAEEEAAARSARDNAGERALRQMMGGTLAGKGGGADGEANPFALPRPAWLVAMGLEPDAVNPKMLTEEQARELKEWSAKEKALSEERAKRVGVLELELRTAKAAVEEAVARFDEALAVLATKRHKVAGEIAALEARILGLAAALSRCARTAEGVEKGLITRLGAVKEAHGRAASELSERRAVLAELEGRQTALAAEERQLDRNFKKEFADADVHFNRLLQLYRARRPEHLAPGTSVPPPPTHAGTAAGAQSHLAGGVEASSPSGRTAAPGLAHHLGRQPSHNARDAGAAAAASAAGAAEGTAAAAHAAPVGPPAPPGAPPIYWHAPPSLPSHVAATSLEPFPELPQPGSRPGSSVHPTRASHSHSHAHTHAHGSRSGSISGHGHGPAAAAASAGSSVPHMDASLRPEGLDVAVWEAFVSYRSDRLAVEGELRAMAVQMALARRDLPELEAREGGLGAEVEGLMASITQLRVDRRTQAYDNEVPLRLLAGQVEAAPPPPGVSADMSDARLMHRGVVEQLNSVVLGKGAKKIDILTAIKDFKHGIYTAQWEAAAADMTLDDLRAKIRDLQLLHVTRDMQSVLKDGEDRSAALEAASLEALMKQRERLHAKAVEDKKRRLRRLGADVSSRSGQNAEVAVHLVTLGKVLEEQQRLQAGMQSANEQAARRMRSLVTHKKLKEIALAQQRELAELRAAMEKLRLRTYPTFAEAPPVAGMPLPPARSPPDLRHGGPAAGQGPSPSTAGAAALGVGSFRPLRS